MGWTKTEWSPSDLEGAAHMGILETESEESFDVLRTERGLIFGSVCNVGFMESGYILREPDETDNHLLEELLADLNVVYSDGVQYVSRIVVNERI